MRTAMHVPQGHIAHTGVDFVLKYRFQEGGPWLHVFWYAGLSGIIAPGGYPFRGCAIDDTTENFMDVSPERQRQRQRERTNEKAVASGFRQLHRTVRTGMRVPKFMVSYHKPSLTFAQKA